LTQIGGDMEWIIFFIILGCLALHAKSKKEQENKKKMNTISNNNNELISQWKKNAEERKWFDGTGN
jgi:hypothetical protein